MGVNYWSSVQATLNINRTQELRMPIALSSSEAQSDLLKMLSNVRAYLVTGDSIFRQQYQESRHDFEQNLAEMEVLFQEWQAPIQLEQLKNLRKFYEAWSELPPYLFDLKDNRFESEPAFRLWEEEGEILTLQILDNIDKISREQKEKFLSGSNLSLFTESIEFRINFSLLIADIRNYITTRQEKYRFDYVAHYRLTQSSLAFLKDRADLLSQDQQEYLDEVNEKFLKIEAIIEKIMLIMEGDRYREDLYVYQSKAEPIAKEMLIILNYIVETQELQFTSELKSGVSSLNTSQLQTLIGSLFVLSLGILMTLVLRRTISDPIQRLTEVTRSVRAGNLDIKASVESGDEIGILSKTLNEMTDSLKQSLNALENYSKNLELLVEERTQELQIKNEELQDTLTNLKETQSHLIQAEKMSSLGQMVAGIAHEINNPVSFIQCNLSPLMAYCQDLLDFIEEYQPSELNYSEIQKKAEEIDLEYIKEDLPKLVESMYMGTRRIHEIILSLKNFSRIDQANLKEANIHEGLESTLLILQHRLKSVNNKGRIIHVNKEYGDLPLIECYPGELNQVFMNILANGIEVLESMIPEEKGEELEDGILTIHTEYQVETDKVLIQISDNGPGMNVETAQKIFDPFFTTKPVGKGTGLGLSISYKIIVEHHQGILKCYSEPGQGARFDIELPAHQRLTLSPDLPQLGIGSLT
jgi:signal transduction histidine kinase